MLSPGSRVWFLTVLPDGRLASGELYGKITLWPKDFAGEPVVLSQGSWVSTMTVLPDGRLASGARRLSMRRAASARIPCESAASIEALGHARVPLGGFRPDHRAGVELTATDTHRCRRWCRSNSRWKPGR
jgi:hypothetical protein